MFSLEDLDVSVYGWLVPLHWSCGSASWEEEEETGVLSLLLKAYLQ